MRLASLALATALNAFLRKRLPAELYERLAGREIEIVARSPAVRASFKVQKSHFVPTRPTGRPWLRFSASARDFALLAARAEDADTLFFNRRLVVEGDTESALLVKNALDCIEAPRVRKVLRRLLRV